MEYDDILNKLRETENLESYDLLIAFYKIIQFHNVDILLHELQVFSSLALRFVYDYNFPLIYEDLSYFKESLKHYLNFQLNSFPFEYIHQLKPPFVIFNENVLVIETTNEKLVCEHNLDRFEKSLKDFLDTSTILTLDVVPTKREELYSNEKFKMVIETILKNFANETTEIDGHVVSLGKSALRRVINDLSSKEVSFNGDLTLHFSRSFQDQFSSLIGLKVYLLGMYHFLNYKEQKILFDAISSLTDAILYSKEFLNLFRHNVRSNLPIQMDLRRRGANSLRRYLASFERFVYILENLRR